MARGEPVGGMTWRWRLGALAAGLPLAVAGFGVAGAQPAGAQTPTTYYVSNGSGTDATAGCATTSYTTIQSAVDAASAGDTVYVCAGTYAETVAINKNITLTGDGANTVIQPTGQLGNCSTTGYDVGPYFSTAPAYPYSYIVQVSGSAGATISDLTVDGSHVSDNQAPGGTNGGCSTNGDSYGDASLLGVDYNDSQGTVSNVTVTGINEWSPASQQATGIWVGGGTGPVTVSGSTISSFFKNGLTCVDANADCSFNDDHITGSGPEQEVGQNGVLLFQGATGSVAGSTISNLDYDGTAGGEAAGVAVDDASGVTVNGNTLTDAQQAIAVDNLGLTSTVATMSGETVSRNTINYDGSYPSYTNSPNNPVVQGIQIAPYAAGTSVSASVENNTLDGPAAEGYNQTSPTLDTTSSGLQIGDSGATGNVSVTATGNTFTGWVDDVTVAGTSGGTSTPVLHYNDLDQASAYGVDNATSGPNTTTTPDATQNWWGCTAGPNKAGCTKTNGAVSDSPWATTPVAGGGSGGGASTPPAAPAGSTSSDGCSSTGGSCSASTAGTTATGTGTGTMTVAQYGSDPVAAPSGFTASGEYFDVAVGNGSNFSSIAVKNCDLNGGNTLYWFNGSGSTGVWEPVVGDPGPTYSAGPPPCASVTLDSASSPTLAQLTGTVFAVAQTSTTPTPPSPPPTTPPPASSPTEGYWMVAADGGVFSYGNAHFHGSTGGMKLDRPIVGMAATPDGHGYWLVASDGGVFSYGDAHFYGSTGGMKLDKAIVGMAATPSGHGYWLVAADGGVFSFGDAHFHGSTGGTALTEPIVGMAAAPGGDGYYLVARDGGIFAFGPGAHFQGSTGSVALTKPIVGMTVDPSTGGYWLVASDGGIFAFHAPFDGSTGRVALDKPIVGMVATPTGQGYWLMASDGGVFSFGDAHFYGSTGGTTLAQPVVGASGS